jgi:hypothetical protein
LDIIRSPVITSDHKLFAAVGRYGIYQKSPITGTSNFISLPGELQTLFILIFFKGVYSVAMSDTNVFFGLEYGGWGMLCKYQNATLTETPSVSNCTTTGTTSTTQGMVLYCIGKRIEIHNIC